MKKSFIKGFLYSLVLLLSSITITSYAATPMLYFTSQPGSTGLSGTTTLTYVVKNNVPAPMPLTSFNFTSSPYYSVSGISNNCHSSGYAIVPASGGTCTISVALAATSAGVTNNAKLTIGYSSQSGTELVSDAITVTTTDAGAVSFTSQPLSPQAVTIGDTTNLVYQVTNTTNTSQLLSNLSFPASSRYTVDPIVVSGAGTCSSNSVPSTGSCTITVPIKGVSAGLSAGRLSVDYGSTPTPIAGSNLIVLNISGSSITPLAFVAPQPTSPQSVNTGGSLNLDYKVTNPNATSVNISGIAFTSNALYSSKTITVSGTGCSLTSIPPSTSTPFCTYTVHITAGSTAGSATNQQLTIDYTGGSPLQSDPITVNITSTTATLFFTVQASSTSVAANGATTLTYQVQNPSSSAVSFTPTFTSSALFSVGTITNSCSGVVPANNGACNITVPITAGSTAGVATNQFLTIDDGGTPFSSSAINITITSAASQLLTFAPPTQGVWDVLLSQAVNIPFTVNNTTSSAVPLTGLTFTPSALYTVGTITVTGTGCSTASIPASGTCTVTVPITANATTTGSVLGQLEIDYTGGGPLIYTPPITINVTNSATSLSFGTPMPVIENMQTYMQQTLVYPVQNNTNSDVTLTSVDVTSSGGTATDASVVNYLTSCHAGTQGVVAANQTCYVVVTLTTNGTTGNVAQNLEINYSGGPLTSPIDFNVATQSSSRTLTFINQCTNQSIALGINPGTVNNVSNTSTSCNTSSDCNQGASCVLTNQVTGDKQCVWNAPVPADGNYQLAAAASAGQDGGTQTVTVPYDSTENSIIAGEIFNTGVSGRTGCTSAVGSCSTADCSNNVFPSNGACNPSTGFQQPASTGEINLFLGSLPAPAPPTDTYDGSSINGFNVPFSITPSISNGRSLNPYACGIPGNPAAVSSPSNGTLGGCNWNYAWGANEIYFTRITSPTATTCTPSTNCGTGLVCGVSTSNMQAAANATPQTYCGTFAGYWSAGQACSLNNVGSPFNCTTQSSGLALSSWYLCNGGAAAVSCYGGTANNCCGCQDWNAYNPALPVPTAPIVTSCGTATSTGWTDPASPGFGTPLSFAGVAKQACPSFYSYQFDDPSSTFNCGAAANGLDPHVGTVNTTDYTVTFCPAGQSGAPT